MGAPIQGAVYNGLSDALSAALDTGNSDEVIHICDDICQSMQAGQISHPQYLDLLTDARVAGYDV